MHNFFIAVFVFLAIAIWVITKDLFMPPFFLFIAFGIWVSRDSRRLAAEDNTPLSTEEKQHLRANFLRPTSMAIPALAVALICYLVAAMEIMNPSLPPFSGRLRHLEAALFSAFGAYGIPGFWVGLGTVSGFLTWNHKK